MRTFVTFEADFLNDEELGTDRTIERPAGRNILIALCDILSLESISLSEVEPHEFYGWTFDVILAGTRVQLLLQFPGPWLLSFLQSRTISGLFYSRASLEDSLFLAISKVAMALQKDKRFSEVRWFFKDDYESGRIGNYSSMP